MNEEALNTSLRKFLKVVGVTSQREIEKAIREAISRWPAERQRDAVSQGGAFRREFRERDRLAKSN